MVELALGSRGPQKKIVHLGTEDVLRNRDSHIVKFSTST